MSELAPPFGKPGDVVTDGQRHAGGLFDVVRLLDRIVEEDHYAVTGEPLQRATRLGDAVAQRSVVFAQNVHDVLRLC